MDGHTDISYHLKYPLYQVTDMVLLNNIASYRYKEVLLQGMVLEV